jgi:hypothetical protein
MEKINRIIIFFLIFCIFSINNLLSQVLNVKTPEPAKIEPNFPNQPYQKKQVSDPPNIDDQNRTFQTTSYSSLTSQQHKELQKVLSEEKESAVPLINYKFPLQNWKQGTDIYYSIYDTLSEMLVGLTPLSLKKAVFLIENAYLDNKMDYRVYSKTISDIIDTCKQLMIDKGYDRNNNVAKIMVLHQYMSDSIKIKDPKTKKIINHYPIKYDFEDAWGSEDWTKMFVTKLLAKRSGQCHSLPLLFLILCEEIGAKAYLSYSPSHSYIKFIDSKGRWNNLELTNGHLTTDDAIIGSGFIKAEALANHIYMDTLNMQQTAARCLTDLANGYSIKYGYDSFVLKCLNKALEYKPNDIFALQQKSDYYTLLLNYVLRQINFPALQVLKDKYPEGYALLKSRNSMYELIDNLGYESMSAEEYELWRSSLDDEIQKHQKNVSSRTSKNEQNFSRK